MSYFSKGAKLDFYGHGLEELGLNPMGLAHDGLIEKIACLDKESFPTPWNLEQWRKVFKEPRNPHLVGLVYKDFKVEGFILLGIVDPDTAHLLKILVEPQLSRNGIATEMLRKAKDILQKLQYKTIFLEVEQSNFEALAFYRKHDYKVLVTKNDFYGPMRHAWAMEHIL